MERVFEERFWKKVNIRGIDECWNWEASLNLRGRGIYNPRRCKKLGISPLSYRVAWILTYGPIPNGMYVCHKCDNPRCCNPSHLFLGTPQDNIIDMIKKGRSGKSKLNEDQVLKIRVDSRPRREIAREFGVTLNMVQKIKSGHSWRSI